MQPSQTNARLTRTGSDTPGRNIGENFLSHAVRELGELAAAIAAPAGSLLSYSSNLTDRQRTQAQSAAKHAAILRRRAWGVERMRLLQDGRLSLSYARVDMVELARLLGGKFDTVAARLGTRWQMHLPETVEVEVDPAVMEHILLNLFVHAFKTAERGGEIDCRFGADGGDGRIELRLRPFQGQPSSARLQETGTVPAESFADGMAVELAAGLVRRLGGTISMALDGPGVAYLVRFPLRAPGDQRVRNLARPYALATDALLVQGAIEELDEEPVVGLAPLEDSRQRPLVLVVEDEGSVTELISDALDVEFRVVSASDGREGLDRAVELKPDLIIADLGLPGMSGEEMIDAIRRRPELDRIPIVVLSGNTNASLRVKLLREGVQDYVTKPVAVEELLARTRNQAMIKRTRDILEDDLRVTSTTLEDLARRVAIQKREFETGNRLRDEFVATLSHDLRTPLTSIHGWVRLLQTQQLDQTIRSQALGSIERNVRALTASIEELLDLSRIVTGKVDLDVDLVELNPILASAVEEVRIAAEAKDVAIRTVFDPTSRMVLGDAGRLKQVAGHLIGNAVKFAKPGGSVEVSLTPLRSQVEIQVRDDGAGISPDFLPHVFDSFRQADGSTTRVYPGLGLGLAIVKALVELHGGTVEARSDGVGQGSCFMIRLPVFSSGRPASGPGTETFQFPETSDDLEGLKVLLVEDDPDTRSFLTVLLEQSQARVRAYAEADPAIDAFREWCPDVLIFDIGLPRKDGYELVDEIRKRETGPAVPAIALTAYTTTEDRERALAAGFQTHVSKPIDPEELVRIIQSLARDRRQD